MTVTLRAVAEAAGVSLSTASRALNGSPTISAGTRSLISATATELGYRPNRAASALRSKRSQLIGLVLNNLINASFHTIAEVVQRRLSEEGYQLILGTTDANPHTEEKLLHTLADHGVDGVIIIGSGQNAATTNQFLAQGMAVVNVIRSSKDSAAPTVLAGDQSGALEATDYLISLGHKRIGYIGGPDTADSGRDRLRGYLEALERRGIARDDELIVQGAFTPQFGAAAVDVLLSRSPAITALFAANHEAVFGVLPGLIARGVHVPRDLSLICYEDMPMLQMWQPPITVVDNGAYQLAELAVDLLLRQIRDSKESSNTQAKVKRISRTYRVGAQLVHRESTFAMKNK